MPFDPVIHHRRSIRLQGYDYSQAGAYFVTLVTQDRASLFGEMKNTMVALNALGECAAGLLLEIPSHFEVHMDEWVMMPNHLHAILFIQPGNPTVALDHCEIALRGTKPASLGAILQNYKSISTRRINFLRNTPGMPVWQRNYYEHIIRNEVELERIRQYILRNPLAVEEDF